MTGKKESTMRPEDRSMISLTSQEFPPREQRDASSPHLRVNPILMAMRAWSLHPADLLWAIERGASKPNDKRSRQLVGCATIGGARLKPFDGEWTISRAYSDEGVELAACIEHARKVLVRLVPDLAGA